MTKPKPDFTGEPIHPDYIYRLSSPVVRGVLGLGITQAQLAVERGELPPPIPLTASGRAMGYTGQMLLDIQAERLARAAAATSKQTKARRRHTEAAE
jgi:hypothetical protein